MYFTTTRRPEIDSLRLIDRCNAVHYNLLSTELTRSLNTSLLFNHSLFLVYIYDFFKVLYLNINKIKLLDGWLVGWLVGWMDGWMDGLID